MNSLANKVCRDSSHWLRYNEEVINWPDARSRALKIRDVSFVIIIDLINRWEFEIHSSSTSSTYLKCSWDVGLNVLEHEFTWSWLVTWPRMTLGWDFSNIWGKDVGKMYQKSWGVFNPRPSERELKDTMSQTPKGLLAIGRVKNCESNWNPKLPEQLSCNQLC